MKKNICIEVKVQAFDDEKLKDQPYMSDAQHFFYNIMAYDFVFLDEYKNNVEPNGLALNEQLKNNGQAIFFVCRDNIHLQLTVKNDFFCLTTEEGVDGDLAWCISMALNFCEDFPIYRMYVR